jgi:hypothetical protein
MLSRPVVRPGSSVITLPRGVELALGRVEHRFQVPEVGRDGHHLGGDHDLVLVGDRLRVVALQEPATARALDHV